MGDNIEMVLSGCLPAASINERQQPLWNILTASLAQLSIEIINNTREGIVIFFTEKKGNAFFGEANSSPGCRARRLLAELMLP